MRSTQPPYFGHRRGGTWLNVVNDQVMGIGGHVVPAPRDLLYILDAILNRDGVLARDDPALLAVRPRAHRAVYQGRRSPANTVALAGEASGR